MKSKMEKKIIDEDTIYICHQCGEEYYKGPRDIMDVSAIDFSKIEVTIL